MMDDILNDIETGVSPTISHHPNKKIRKRKQLNNLLKFRLKKTNSNDILRSSEDELFLPQQKPSPTKSHSSRYSHCWKYSQSIISFVFTCIFMIVCIGLVYTNIELKNEVHNLTLRVNEVERKSSDMKLSNMLSTMEQIKGRLSLLELWNFSMISDRLQKLQLQMLLNDNDHILSNNRHVERRSTQFPKIMNRIKVFNQQSKNMINESITEWNEQINSLRNKIRYFNESIKIQELIIHFEQLTDLVYNSSDKTSMILIAFQSDLDKLWSKINQCNCSKAESSIPKDEQWSKNIITKPTVINTSSIKSASISFEELNDENKQIENDVEQIVNRRSVIG